MARRTSVNTLAVSSRTAQVLMTLVVLATMTVVARAQAPIDAPTVSLFPSPWGRVRVAQDREKSDDPWRLSWAEAYAQARVFVSNLTLVEKVNLTTGTGWEFDRCIGNTGSIPRLGFRTLCLQDGPVGVRYTDKNSVFPAGINAAATFSRDLMRRRGLAIGSEFRGKGIDVHLGPVAGPLGRSPAGGRNWEGFSPDPYLTGVALAETVEGIQAAGVVACAKHYIVNEQEHFRNNIDVQIDDRTMHELYLWPFADAVHAGVGSIMCSYNKINGHHSCENGWTTNYLLKNELGFPGFVMSDWGAQHSTVSSANGGLDMAMPGDGPRGPGNAYGAFWGGALTEAVLNGTVPVWRLDDMAVRIIAALVKVNSTSLVSRPPINFSAWVRPNITVGPVYFRANVSIEAVNEHVNVQADHAALIREIGARSVVLLKNERQALPLRPDHRRLAVIGDDGQPPTLCEDNRCYRGTLSMGYGSGTANYPYVVSPIEALRKRWPTSANVSVIEAADNWDLAAAQKAAASSDVALVFASATAGEGYLVIEGNAGDRNNLTLWNNGDALIAAVATVNPNTIVILHTVGPVLVDHIASHPNVSAILWAGLPGQESGNALVDVLLGDVAPQGRSPFSWTRSADDYGSNLLIYQAANPFAPSQNFSEGVFIDYRHLQQAGIAPVFPFGHGLTYTQFSFSNLTVTKFQTKNTSSARGSRNSPSASLTDPAPLFGTIDNSTVANMAPPEFLPVKPYIYPWLVPGQSNLSFPMPVEAVPPQATNGSAQSIPPAAGGPGGHPSLFDPLYSVSFTVHNTGNRPSVAVPQLYLSLGSTNKTLNPPMVLRGFDAVAVAVGGSVVVSMNLTRRDLSNWDPAKQQWFITDAPKVLFLGESASKIVLNSTLTVEN